MRTTHSRRPLVAAVTATLAATALLAGCSGAEAPEGEPTPPPETALLPEAEGKVDYPLTLATAWGEVTLEERPERIVAGSWRGDLSWLLALGVTPVAVESSEWALDAVPWAQELLAEPIEHTWTYEDLALEQEPIAGAEPDLIVTTSLGGEVVPNLEQLSTIAPVLAQPEGGDDPAGWRASILLIGEALDLQDRAQAVIDEYDQFFVDFRDAHPEFAGQSIAFLGFHGQNELWYGNPPGTPIAEFFTRQGFAEDTDVPFTDTEAMSPELLGQVEADVLVAVDYSAPEDEGAEFAALVESPLFQSIDAVERGDVLLLSSPARTMLYQDGEEVGPMAHPSVAYDDPIGSPRFADLLAPLISDVLTD